MGKFSDYFRRKADGEKTGNNQYGEEYGYYEDEHGDEYTGRLRDFAPRQSAPAPRQEQSTDPTRSMQNFMVYEPRNADDVQTLIDFLKTRESAIINLDNVEPEISQRVLDFVSGAVYALNGSIHRISGNIFLLSPEGVGITGSYQSGGQDER